MIRVLHVIRTMNLAGAETFIMNVYRNIDRSKIQFDFLLNTNEESNYTKEIRELGGSIYYIPRFVLANYVSYKNQCKTFYLSHPEHTIVHGHIGSSAPIYLPLAHKAGRVTIAHSHNTTPNNSLPNFLFNRLARHVRGKADFYFACSLEAGINRFGSAIPDTNKFFLINNGIDTNLYRKTKSLIIKSKTKMGTLGHPTFLHIGRFVFQKNHSFLIDLFKEITKIYPDAILLLVGEGELLPKIRQKVQKLNLEDNVRFLGLRNDIPDIIRASDVFLFPSLYEGLGIALIEAQAGGLPCVVSDKIPDIACIAPTTKKLNLSSVEQWAKESTELCSKYRDTTIDYTSLIREKGFDIKSTATWLSDFYTSVSINKEYITSIDL